MYSSGNEVKTEVGSDRDCCGRLLMHVIRMSGACILFNNRSVHNIVVSRLNHCNTRLPVLNVIETLLK